MIRRLICWFIGSHEWDDWRELVTPDWSLDTNTEHLIEEGRYCFRCWHWEQRFGKSVPATTWTQLSSNR